MPPATKTPAKPSVAAPERSLVQRMEALQRANQIRTRRAPAQARSQGGPRRRIHDLLLEPPEYVETAKVFDMLLAVPKYGRVKVNKVLSSAGSRRARRSAASRSASAPSSSRCCAASPYGDPERRFEGDGVARVFVITGPSGVGKGTLIRALRERVPELELSVSATTRRARPGEHDGVDYHFLDDEEFEARVSDGRFVEHARYSGRRYGTLRSELEQRGSRRPAGGARDRGPGRAPGPRDDARGRPGLHRAAERGGAARAAGRPRHRRRRGGRARRLATAREELAAQREFAHVVVNDRLEDAVAELEGLVRGRLPA